MDITLITAVGSDLVHGTENDKKTGCGINLLKADNVTRYRRAGTMTDLKEITCEKCKSNLAKKIISSKIPITNASIFYPSYFILAIIDSLYLLF